MYGRMHDFCQPFLNFPRFGLLQRPLETLPPHNFHHMSTVTAPSRRGRRALSPPTLPPKPPERTSGSNGSSASLSRILRRGQTMVPATKEAVLQAREPEESEYSDVRRVSRTGIVERSMAAAVIAAARQRGLARKPRQVASQLPAHHLSHGGFCNPWDSAYRESGLRSRAASRTFFHKVAKDRRPPDEQLAGVMLLAGRPQFSKGAETVDKEKYALASFWIGHTTFVLKAQGITVLTDPVWSSRLGPLGPRRLIPPPCEIEELPEIDVVVLSNANYDALDKVAVAALKDKVGIWLVPLGVKALIVAAGIEEGNVVQMDWWQEYKVKETTFVCTPAQHFSVREDALWCSWLIQAPHHSAFFCGGTGYRSVNRDVEDSEIFERRQKFGGQTCPAFKEICRRYGAVDTALLPIGGFKPRVAVSSVQGDAVDMLFIHRDLRARRSLVHRWGTFACNDEGMLDAVRALEAGILNSDIPEHEVSYVRHGRLHVT